jgi:hypothetical protein
MSFQNWYKSCIAGGTAVTMKVGPKVAVLMTPFVLERARAGCKAGRPSRLNGGLGGRSLDPSAS